MQAQDKSGVPVQGADGPLLDSYRVSRNPKDRSVGIWNVDGELLRQPSLSLRSVQVENKPPTQVLFGECVFHPSPQTPAQPKTTFLFPLFCLCGK